MIRLVYLLSFCFAFLLASCQSADERVKGWNADIDYLLQQIRQHHYVYRSAPLPKAMMDLVGKIRSSIRDYSDERMLIELERLMYYLGDGHSYIFPAGARVVNTHYLPLQFYGFSDGLFIIDAENDYKKYIGYKLTSAGPVKADQFMKDMEHYISQDNKMGAVWIGPLFLRFRGMLESYGMEKSARSTTVELEDAAGKQETVQVNFIPYRRRPGIPKLIPSQITNSPAPLYLDNVERNYWMKNLPQNRVLYFQYNQVINGQDESISSFARRLSDSIASIKPKHLIIDVRHNNGGNGELNEPLVRLLENFENANPSGRIIVITGRNTFSAAQLFISQVDKRTRAIFAGEPSSSKPNFVGEESEVVLPWSGAFGSISNRYHENIPGDKRQWIEPEIKVTLSSKAYFANQDPVMVEVLKHLN